VGEGLARAGEPWIFGLGPGEVEHFFGSRGFKLRYDTSTLEAGQVWLTGQRRREHGSALYRIAIADIDTTRLSSAHAEPADLPTRVGTSGCILSTSTMASRTRCATPCRRVRRHSTTRKC